MKPKMTHKDLEMLDPLNKEKDHTKIVVRIPLSMYQMVKDLAREENLFQNDLYLHFIVSGLKNYKKKSEL